ncbi:carbohydrate ABC transporter permease [Paenibacillus sp. sgz302251]|uniref:carbohydrate ABC transporter permease n=1 Tax=Paenibacillus sp. sgz302251 TaxID=3414493 RepID=UPI003C7CED83
MVVQRIGRLSAYAFLLVTVLISIFPFYWMFVIGSNTTADANRFPPVIVPGSLYMENITNVFNNIEFFRALGNTVIVSVAITAAQLFFSSLAAFALSRLHFKGRHVLFVFIVTTLMIPQQLGIIPLYIIMQNLSLINTLTAVILPGIVGAYGIFWMKQYMDSSVHYELIESARIDGCGTFRTYATIALPIMAPALATLGIIMFMGTWNDFLWPSIVLKDSSVHTIQIALRNLNKVYFRDIAMIMSGTFLATIPLLIVVGVFSRYFISGITAGAVKA